MHERNGFMKKTGDVSSLRPVVLAGPVHAGGVSVAEGETARFQITVTPKFTHRNTTPGPQQHSSYGCGRLLSAPMTGNGGHW